MASVQHDEYRQVEVQFNMFEKSCDYSAAGSLFSIAVGAIAGGLVSCATNSLEANFPMAVSVTVGAIAGATGCAVGRVAQKAFSRINNSIISMLGGSVGGAALVSSMGNMLFFNLDKAQNSVPQLPMQFIYVAAGFLVGSVTVSNCGSAKTSDGKAGGIISLGLGSATGACLGAAFGSLLPELGTTNGLLLGISGAAGAIAGYCLPYTHLQQKPATA
jgi:hypothetical protein